MGSYKTLTHPLRAPPPRPQSRLHLLTVLVLAGGLGLSTFTFSFLHTAMIRPLPFDGGDRIVRLTRLGARRHAPSLQLLPRTGP